MKHSNSLPSPLKIAAEVDAALAQAGLAGPQVEREAIPLYLSFAFEMTGESYIESQLEWTTQELAMHLESWCKQEDKSLIDVLKQLTSSLDEVVELCKVHGTLSDFKRREILRFHQQVVNYLQYPQTLIVNRSSNS